MAGAVTSSAVKHIPRRVMLGELERPPPGKADAERVIPREHEKQWTRCLNNDREGFGSIGDWKEAAKNAVCWCEAVKDEGGNVQS